MMNWAIFEEITRDERERIDRIKEETKKMFPKKWDKMYFSEQQKALKKDKKYNYVHLLLKISNEHSDEVFEKWQEGKIRWQKAIEEKWRVIHEIQAQRAEERKRLEQLDKENLLLKTFIIKHAKKLDIAPMEINANGITVSMDRFVEYDKKRAYKEVIEELKKKAVKWQDGAIIQYRITDTELNQIIRGEKE